jgi:hypothetical protein
VVEFTIGKRRMEVTKEKVEGALRKMEPEPLKGRMKYYVEYEGRRYPIKQVISVATGLPKVSFTTMHAYKVLRELGFEVKELEGGG